MSVHVHEVESLPQAEGPETHIGDRAGPDEPVEGDLPARRARPPGAPVVEASRER